MQMTEEYAKKQGYKKLSRTKHWYRFPKVVGNVWAKLGVKSPRSVCFEQLRHGGGVYIVYTFLHTATSRIKVLGVRDSFINAQHFAESWMRQND